MPRLVDPTRGTVVGCGDELAARLRSRGWRDADAPAEQVEVPSGELQGEESEAAPKRRGRPRRSE